MAACLVGELRERAAELAVQDHTRGEAKAAHTADRQAFGLMFWLTRNRLSGSYLALIAASRL